MVLPLLVSCALAASPPAVAADAAAPQDAGVPSGVSGGSADAGVTEWGKAPVQVLLPAQPMSPEAEKQKGYTFLPVPLVAYDSDNGVAFGLAGALFYNDGVSLPYRYSLIAQVLITTVGVSQDYVKADLLHLFGTDFRINAELRFLHEPNASFFGIGNTTVNQPMGRPFSYYQYRQTNPAWRIEVRHPVTEHIFVYAGYLIEYAIICVYGSAACPGASSYLNDLQLAGTPIPGTAGGLNSPLQGGLVYDTRDFEPWPRNGQYSELAIRGAQHWTGSSYEWVGATGIWRAYLGLPWDLVLAGRILIDVMHGTVPFYDEDSTGGLEEMDGLGGFNSMRGFVKDRFMGDGKVLGNLELRRMFWGLDLFSQHVDLGAILFADVGRVYGHSFEDGPPFLIHWDGGFGLRAMLNRDLVIRGDLGFSVEGPRVYILFNNMF